MARHYPSTMNQFLYSVEAIYKVFGVLYSRNVAAYFAKTLCKGTTTKMLFVKTEVNMIETGVLIVNNHRTNCLLYVANFTSGADNYSARSNDFLSVWILL